MPFIASVPEDQLPCTWRWLEAMSKHSDESKIIAHNWLTDQHLTAASARTLAAVLHTRDASAPACDLECFDVLAPAWMTEDTKVKHPPDGTLSCVRKLRSLKRFDPDDAYGSMWNDPATARFALMDLVPSRHLKGQIQAKAPICWAVPATELEHLPGADAVRDALGLDYAPTKALLENTLVDIRYARSSIAGADIYIPTSAEASNHPAFLPALPDADSGFTQDLKSGARALPEFVHRPVDIARASEIRWIGELKSAPPRDWISVRLYGINDTDFCPPP